MSATKKNVESKYDIDNVVPLLLAALGNPAINYKTMEAMDELSRTEYAWQHRFRVWKAKAKEIAEKNPDHAPPMTGTPTKKRTPASKSKATVADNGKAAALNNDDDEAGVVKKEVDDSVCTLILTILTALTITGHHLHQPIRRTTNLTHQTPHRQKARLLQRSHLRPQHLQPHQKSQSHKERPRHCRQETH